MSSSPSRRSRGQGVAATARSITGTLVFEGGTIVFPDRLVEGSRIVCREGRIAAIGPRVALPRDAVTIDARGAFLAPGFIDLHVHGGGGADFMDGDAAAVRTALATHARHGTTTIFPTTIPRSPGLA